MHTLSATTPTSFFRENYIKVCLAYARCLSVAFPQHQRHQECSMTHLHTTQRSDLPDLHSKHRSAAHPPTGSPPALCKCLHRNPGASAANESWHCLAARTSCHTPNRRAASPLRAKACAGRARHAAQSRGRIAGTRETFPRCRARCSGGSRGAREARTACRTPCTHAASRHCGS